jgi:hypothetical protein
MITSMITAITIMTTTGPAADGRIPRPEG